RQAQNSGIIQLAHEIIHDTMNMKIFEKYKDIHFYNCTNLEMIKNVTKIVQLALDQGYTMNDIQVLAPMYQGVAGIDHLNMALQEIFNPNEGQDEYRIGKKIFRVGDKILQLKNRPEDDVYNGDIGILVEICPKDGFEYLEDTLIVEFDDKFVEYTSKDFFTITHAYCMSIHKSQGNEFKIVIMSVLNDYHVMLKRNLIYTGLTRAKQSLFILGSQKALLYGIENCFDVRRKTSLIDRLTRNKEISVYDFLDEGDNE
ncbi:MAG: ATP-binding domain-containing protein, partial [Faecalibacillus sp.]